MKPTLHPCSYPVRKPLPASGVQPCGGYAPFQYYERGAWNARCVEHVALDLEDEKGAQEEARQWEAVEERQHQDALISGRS